MSGGETRASVVAAVTRAFGVSCRSRSFHSICMRVDTFLFSVLLFSAVLLIAAAFQAVVQFYKQLLTWRRMFFHEGTETE